MARTVIERTYIGIEHMSEFLKDRLFLAMIVIGCALRVIWPTDMEWKTDEKLLFSMAEDAEMKGAIPEVGMGSGGGIMNPGMSVGVFALIAAITDGPIGMVQAVQWINVISLLGFLVIAFFRYKGNEQKMWFAGLALAAISPLAVIFSRKIWAQDLLPAFAFLITLAHWHRGKWVGAFTWGLMGALMGQVHMSGFYYAFGLFSVSVLHDHFNEKRIRWIPWLTGSAAGAILLLPWLQYLLHNEQNSAAHLSNIVQLNFFFYWLIDALGLDVYYSLRENFWEYLREPLIGSTPTYLVAALHIALVFLTAVVVRELYAFIRKTVSGLKGVGSMRAFFMNMSATKLQMLAILVGIGVLFPLTGVTVVQHYLICTFPFMYVFIAHLLSKQERVMRAMLVVQLLVTLGFLWYIHTNGGAPEGDYGVNYRTQMEKAQ
ncbi:MAG: hypothetical protein IPO90_06840 [Flavobacteriales bacterium]|nr:hypothetical protein [Flavobacteriales bacterium]